MIAPASRRDARERAIELLYEAEAKSAHPHTVVDALPLKPEAFALELSYGVADHRHELDHLLGRYAQRWPVSRMAVMDRAVLRAGAFELATQLEVPSGAVLSEWVELGGQYGSTDDTSRFVNGILANVAKEVRDGGPRPWLPIEVVVFDMDGVIRHWTEGRFEEFEAEFGVDKSVIGRIAFSEPIYDQAMTGVLTAAEWCTEIGRRAAEAHDVDADAVARAWAESSWRVDEAVVELVRRVKAAGTRVALFSNATTNLEIDMAKMGVDDLFDPIGNSARIGKAKPAIDAYEAVADLIGADAHRLLFVDDREENVVGACDAGWHAVLMTDADRLEATLRRVGALPS